MMRGWSRLGRYDVLVIVAGIWFLGKSLRYAFPPLFDQLKLTFEVSNTAVGIAFTGFMIVYAIMQFPSGVLADRFGSALVIGTGVLTAALGAAVVVLGGPFGLLVLAMLIMGAGTGAHKTVAIKLLAVTYPARTGRTLGVFDTVGTFGGVIAPLGIAGIVGYGLNWRVIFVLAAIVGILLALAVIVRIPQQLPDVNSETTSRSIRLRDYAVPFTDGRFLAFVILTLCFSFAYNGVVAFLPLFLVQEVGTSTAVASLLYSVLFIVSVVQIVTGELADRVGPLTVITATLGTAAVSLGLLVLSPQWSGQFLGIPAITAVAVVGIGIGSHGFRPVRGAHLEALLPDSLAGGGLGAVRSALMGAGAVAPAIVGFTADISDFTVAFALLFGSLGIGALIGVGLLLTRPSRE